MKGNDPQSTEDPDTTWEGKPEPTTAAVGRAGDVQGRRVLKGSSVETEKPV